MAGGACLSSCVAPFDDALFSPSAQLQHLHLQLGSDRTGTARAELARLKTTYEHRFKFTGKV